MYSFLAQFFMQYVEHSPTHKPHPRQHEHIGIAMLITFV